MPRPVRPWFRAYVEMVGDRKIRRLTPAQRWLWVAILAAARESPVSGSLYVAEGLPMTLPELADYADVKEREASSGLALMQQLSMVTLEVDGLIVVRNFPKRQFESDTSTPRTQRHRQKNGDATFQPRSEERSRNRDGNTPETETETETETEKPLDARKRAHRLPENWTPSAMDVEWQRAEGITDLQARRETEKFRDHWKAASGQTSRKLDWSAAWRNWLRRAKEDGRFRSEPVRQVSGGW